MGMKPIKIECPSCGQHIEIAPPQRRFNPSFGLVPSVIGTLIGVAALWFGHLLWSAHQWEKNYYLGISRHGAMMTNAVLQVATNAVPGITAIAELSIEGDQFSPPSNWSARVTVDYVPAKGGMARTNLPVKFYDFSDSEHVSAHLDEQELDRRSKARQ